MAESIFPDDFRADLLFSAEFIEALKAKREEEERKKIADDTAKLAKLVYTGVMYALQEPLIYLSDLGRHFHVLEYHKSARATVFTELSARFPGRVYTQRAYGRRNLVDAETDHGAVGGYYIELMAEAHRAKASSKKKKRGPSYEDEIGKY